MVSSGSWLHRPKVRQIKDIWLGGEQIAGRGDVEAREAGFVLV
jgi:hypothetical protein